MEISSGRNEIFFISQGPLISRARGDYGKGTPASSWDHDMTLNKRLQIVRVLSRYKGVIQCK